MVRCFVLAFIVAVLAAPSTLAGAALPTLAQELAKEKTETLVEAARTQGDIQRGSLIFYRAELSCVRCHVPADEGARLGPDLAKIGKDGNAPYLIESVLAPTKVIKKGFETVTIITKAGKSVSGLLAEERGNAIVLRDAARDGQQIVIPKEDIDERHDKAPSVMPEGLVNALSSRQEFLDLIRYLIEIAEKGPSALVSFVPRHRFLPPCRCRRMNEILIMQA